MPTGETSANKSRPETALDRSPFAVFKYTYAVLLLAFSVVLVMGLIFTCQTSLSSGVHPACALVVCWALLIWLSMVEGGQCSMVGLPPVDRELYKVSHPLTYKICELGHRGDNLDRYLMGRQFLVVFIVFFINLSAAPISADAGVFGLPEWVITVFLQTGAAMILFTAQIGQLAAQCNASHMMLDYINNYFMLFTLYISLAIEFSGVLHASYVIQYVVAKLAGKPITSLEPARSLWRSIFFWGRCLMSVGILAFAIVVTLTALFESKTTMWKSIPDSVAVILFFTLMSVVGLLEGMQIAFFAVAKMDKEDLSDARCAKMTCDLLFEGKGRNLPGFMIGRQICVVGCMFVVARVCTLNVEIGTGENVLGVADWFQSFLNTGLLAALITTIIGSIAWQLVASAFPIAFLSNPVVYVFLRWCLFLEATGICSGAWVIARIAELVAGWKTDEHYVGTPEDRKKRSCEDIEAKGNVGPGHLRNPVHMVGAHEFGISTTYQDSDQSGPAPKAMLEMLMKITQSWNKVTNLEELSSLCEKINCGPPVDATMANAGMQPSGIADPAAQLRYTDTPQAQKYPTPKQIAAYLAEAGQSVPCFLLPPTHEHHVPPHIVAFGLMSGLVKSKAKDGDESTGEGSGYTNSSPESSPSQDPQMDKQSI